MTPPASPARVSAEQFERIYETSADPWSYRSSAYEREKYAATLAALGTSSYARALEVGCSIGVFTELLAGRCEELVAIDFSPRALSLARERLGPVANVEIRQASFPEQAPDGPWELVVCSEVLYYLDREALAQAVRWLEREIVGGASVLAVSWRGKAETEPLRGDEVHDMLSVELARWHTLDARRPGYRIDRFDGNGR